MSITSGMWITPPLWKKVRRNQRASWLKWKRKVKMLASNSTFRKLIMASGSMTSWHINGGTMIYFTFLSSKITQHGNCSHEIKRYLFLGSKAMTNLDSILKNSDITLPTKVHQVKAMAFPVVKYGCESWTIKKAEHWRIDAFELWCCWRLLRVPWTAKKSNQSIIKEISPEYSLEGLTLKLKLQYFGHLMWRTESLGKYPDAGKDWRKEEKGTTENEMVVSHHWLDGCEFDQALGVDNWQGSLTCFPVAVHVDTGLDMTEHLNWTDKF